MPSPAHQVTADDVGPAINVMSWFLTSTAFLAVALRSLTKSFVTSRVTNDDLLIFLSLVVNGLGQRFVNVSTEQRERFQQASYAGDLLHILVLILSKGSILCFYYMLTPVPSHRRAIRLGMPLLAAWGVSAVLVAAFQCRAPHVWNYLDQGNSSCISRSGFFTYFSVSNMLIEAALLAFPIYIIVSKMQTNTSKKMLLISCFLARALVVAALIAEIATRARANVNNEIVFDPTFNYWPVIISQQLTHSLAIITACIPYYVSWVPNAFRIYADTYSNNQAAAARLWKLAGGMAGDGHFGGRTAADSGERSDQYELTLASSGSAVTGDGGDKKGYDYRQRSQRNYDDVRHAAIVKTVETEVQVETKTVSSDSITSQQLLPQPSPPQREGSQYSTVPTLARPRPPMSRYMKR